MSRLSEELRAVLGRREQHVPRFQPSPAAIEEEAASRLYGERTGTVNASPASPPLAAVERAAAVSVPDGGLEHRQTTATVGSAMALEQPAKIA
jgi:hypothetical protein